MISADLAAAAVGTGILLALAIASSKALVSDGFGLDRALAALWCRAKHGETISLIAARGQQAKVRRWCILCAFLNIAVEKDHCPKQLDDNSPPTPIFSGIRAGVLLLLLSGLLWAVPLVGWMGIRAALQSFGMA